MLVILFVNINILSAEILINDAGISYDSKILDEFKTNSEVNVIVTLKANLTKYSSSIKDSDEYNNWIIDIKKRVGEYQSKVIPFLSRDEFQIKYIYELSPSFSGNITRKGFDKLVSDSNIERIEIVEGIYSSLDKSAPLINATQIWTKGYTGEGVTVCVIDSGINYSHPALGGCFGSGCKVKAGYDIINSDSDPMDDYYHGTHVAGIVASESSTYKGIAPNASLIAIKVLNSDGGGDTADLKKGIEWCRANASLYNISIITISINYDSIPYSGICSDSVTDEIDSANSSGIFVDVSSGNNGYNNGIFKPACAAGAISVGAVYDENLGREPDYPEHWTLANCYDSSTDADYFICFTNRGNNLDLLAPGCRINSTWINGDDFGDDCGTSMAAPHVAGAAALLLERDPTLTPDNITTILKNNGKNITDYFNSRNNGNGSNLTFTRIDILAAINSLCTTTDWIPHDCGGSGQNCSSEYDRYYTRTTDPSGCDIEDKCEFDSSCSSGGGPGPDITVCASGCNFTSIQPAINASHTNNRIKITDNRTYNEKLILNSTTSPWIECTNGAIIDGTGISSDSIYFNDVDGPVVMNCYITAFSYGIWLVNSTYGLIRNNTFEYNNVGIQLDDNSHGNKIEMNNIQENNAEGIKLKGYEWSDVSYNDVEELKGGNM